MKKTIAFSLIIILVVSMLAGCASKKAPLSDDLPTLIDEIYKQRPVEFSHFTITPDDPDFGAMWDWNYYTGLANGDKVKEAAVSESMIGSIPFSLVLLRLNDASDARAVAEEMKAGINTSKWICVDANDLLVAGYSDVVMLVMIGESFADQGLTAQAFVDAFQTVCGADLDFTI